MMNFFHPFRKPKKRLFYGFGQVDPTQQADISIRTTSGENIYNNLLPQAPLRSEIVASPIDDPVLANAVSRVQYHPTQAFVTQTPAALVAQPMTYQEMQRQVGSIDYRTSQEPQVYLAYNPTPMQRVDLVPRADYPVVIPAPGTVTPEGGALLPPSQPFARETVQTSREYTYADDLMRRAAIMAAESGRIPTLPYSPSGLSTPTVPSTTIPTIQQSSPFTAQQQEPMSQFLPTAQLRPSQGLAVKARQTDMPVQGDYIQPVEVAVPSRFPWLIVLGGIGILYLIFRGER